MKRTVRMHPLPFLALLLLAPVFTSGCASSGGPTAAIVPATDTPVAFLVEENGALRPPRAGEGCRNPLVDPRTDLRLVLERSEGGHGDYSVPEGRYDVGAGQLLQIDCATGQAIGIVRGKG